MRAAARFFVLKNDENIILVFFVNQILHSSTSADRKKVIGTGTERCGVGNGMVVVAFQNASFFVSSR